MIDVMQTTYANVDTFDLKDRNIVIIGHPGAGKSHLASKIAPKLNQVFIDTDDFKHLGDFVTQLSCLLDRIEDNPKKKYCIVGILAYRLLRHIAKHPYLCNFRPDLIIEVTRDRANIDKLYGVERDINKLARSRALAKGCETILKEYFSLVNHTSCSLDLSTPTFYELYNPN